MNCLKVGNEFDNIKTQFMYRKCNSRYRHVLIITDQTRGANPDCFWVGLYQLVPTNEFFNFTVGGSIPYIAGHYPFVGIEPNVLGGEPYCFIWKRTPVLTAMHNAPGTIECKLICESNYYRPY